MNDDDLTCYHEAGHAVVGFLMGGRIDRIQLGGEPEDNLPDCYGDCIVRWQQLDSDALGQMHCELLTVLAGPVAEMIYRGEKLHPAFVGAWQWDWEQALRICEPYSNDLQKRTQLLQWLISVLHDQLNQDRLWATIAAVADELSAHQYLEHEQLVDHLQFWLHQPYG